MLSKLNAVPPTNNSVTDYMYDLHTWFVETHIGAIIITCSITLGVHICIYKTVNISLEGGGGGGIPVTSKYSTLLSAVIKYIGFKSVGSKPVPMEPDPLQNVLVHTDFKAATYVSSGDDQNVPMVFGSSKGLPQ